MKNILILAGILSLPIAIHAATVGGGSSSAPTAGTNISVSGTAVSLADPFTNSNATITTLTATTVAASSVTSSIVGVVTNSNGNPGAYGFSISSVTGAAINFPASGATGDLLSIALTAGDWFCLSGIVVSTGAATISDIFSGISQTAGNSAAGLVQGDNYTEMTAGTSVTNNSIFSLAPVNSRISISANGTAYLKYSASYTGGPPTARGKLFCWKPR